jgi:nickel/cobalt transporter (NicO) family protein
MNTLLISVASLSIFHALIPSHWLPVVAIGRKEQWTVAQTLRITLLIGSAHVASTLLIGLLLAALGRSLDEQVEHFSHWIAPGILMALGIIYLYRHYYHHHFHLQTAPGRWGPLAGLVVAMFFSPCFEVEGLFLSAGRFGWGFVALLAGCYALITIIGMLIWVNLVLHGLRQLDWHRWEHNAGIITGVALILTALSMFLHG